jgi:hypothetical protein
MRERKDLSIFFAKAVCMNSHSLKITPPMISTLCLVASVSIADPFLQWSLLLLVFHSLQVCHELVDKKKERRRKEFDETPESASRR